MQCNVGRVFYFIYFFPPCVAVVSLYATFATSSRLDLSSLFHWLAHVRVACLLRKSAKQRSCDWFLTVILVSRVNKSSQTTFICKLFFKLSTRKRDFKLLLQSTTLWNVWSYVCLLVSWHHWMKRKNWNKENKCPLPTCCLCCLSPCCFKHWNPEWNPACAPP